MAQMDVTNCVDKLDCYPFLFCFFTLFCHSVRIFWVRRLQRDKLGVRPLQGNKLNGQTGWDKLVPLCVGSLQEDKLSGTNCVAPYEVSIILNLH